MNLLAKARDLQRRHKIETAALLLVLVVAFALLVFLKLASEVRDGETFAFDRWLLLALRSDADPAVPIGPHWLRLTLLDFTALGGTPFLTLITVAGAGYLLFARKRATAVFLVLAISGGAIASTLLKAIFDRARPDLVHHLVEVTNASFPSGHAMNSAIVYLTLGALLARTEESRAIRIYLIALAITLSLIIGFSRIYLGVHWPSDVAAGWCVGGVWAICCSLLARFLQQRRAIEPES
ncbi:MAG TPA: phosphatase PAP2 family protein [Allosphingosinicella sp.]|nr:phosphatase PAP2 family protein [Allosphingosinicella sp.]